jgi:hypothetical protein
MIDGGLEGLGFGVWGLGFGVQSSEFGVLNSVFSGAVKTSVTLLVQDIGNTVTVLVSAI